MPKSLRILPVDYESPEDREADMNSLILRLERQGRLQTVQPIRMMRARTLYCRKLKQKSEVARAVGVTIGDLDRWIMMNDWDKLRHETEFKYYQRVSGIRQKAFPDIDSKHDQMFHNLESLIEDTVFRLKRDEKELEPKDLVALANASKTCMESRRTIHNKEGPVKRHVFSIEDPTLLNDFTNMVLDMTDTKQVESNGDIDSLKRIPFSESEDADIEMEKDDV